MTNVYELWGGNVLSLFRVIKTPPCHFWNYSNLLRILLKIPVNDSHQVNSSKRNVIWDLYISINKAILCNIAIVNTFFLKKRNLIIVSKVSRNWISEAMFFIESFQLSVDCFTYICWSLYKQREKKKRVHYEKEEGGRRVNRERAKLISYSPKSTPLGCLFPPDPFFSYEKWSSSWRLS